MFKSGNLRKLSFVAIFIAALGCQPRSGIQGTQEQGQSDINKNSFYILLFPKHEMLTDITGKERSIKRAAIASVQELEHKQFKMYIGEEEQTFNIADFSPLPKESEIEKYIANLNYELKNWGESTDWRSAELELSPMTSGPSMGAILSLVDRSGRRIEYSYRIDDTSQIDPIGVEVRLRR